MVLAIFCSALITPMVHAVPMLVDGNVVDWMRVQPLVTDPPVMSLRLIKIS